ncbi:hypothetical protein AJ78_03440 [Emergomyces pasteurianus Ep9510]|uniref:Zn(2)-C6 fungal-type domain-containing protein n=1 Tax=Emergomyces pasteurianus Ep9510 TaxID=1447872 RepID=A0A1J9PIQ9_9EURO|nr:hypothetical protein AJ78_03440 [Emergomyces pasteurianus Ep9510]
MDNPDAFATPALRKKRRKAVSNGAADDCFTCANRSVKCDRRRPYCTQCLGLGTQCSGYKTTLTWGVGVASRGKLRGLSWPVSGSQQAASATVAASTRKAAESERRPEPPRSRSRPRPRPAPKTTPRSSSKRIRLDRPARKHTTAAATTSPPRDVDATLLPPPVPLNPSVYHTSASSPGSSMKYASLSQNEAGYPALVHSAASVLSNGYHGSRTVPFRRSPRTETGHPEPIPCVSYADEGVTQLLHPPASQQSISGNDLNSVTTNLPPQLRESSPWNGRIQNHLASSRIGIAPRWSQKTIYDADSKESEQKAGTNFHNKSFNAGSTPSDYSRPNAYYQDYNIPGQTSFIPQPMSTQLIGRTHRMQYLISYYSEVISPVIVAFDSPANPYRMFILELAKCSETLQHALAALSLSNLRQRNKHWGLSAGKTLPARKSSTAHCRMVGLSCEEGFGLVAPEEQQKEESFHKAMAITSLNAQLAHPIQRLADSVLATVLILCLFHMCDTGVAKFQPQLAGVKKLLALRRSANRNCSDLVKWYTRMFVWFDVMTATINNRDCELNGDYLEIAASGHDDWALANLAGCDASMFRIISQLGRLNMLSQEKSLEPYSGNEWPIATAPLPPNMHHHTSMPPPFEKTYDGTNPLQLHLESDIPIAGSDSRAEFWQEWHVLRQRLESWHLQLPETNSAASLYSPLTPAHSTPTNLSDLSNISESFRYSALLYLERLASPHLPSSHPRIQRLVYTSLHYISAVKSDVYLLWPLFVTGAECTLDAHRALIRRHCSDIQKDSGFINNLASLELLEKIWAADSGGWKSGKQLSSPAAAAAAAATTTTTTTAFADVKGSGSPNGWDNPDAQTVDGEVLGFMTQKVPLSGEAFKWSKIMGMEASDWEYIVV